MTRDTAWRVVGLSGLFLVAVVVLAGCAGAGDPAAGVPVGSPGGRPVASGGVIGAAEVDVSAVGGEDRGAGVVVGDADRGDGAVLFDTDDDSGGGRVAVLRDLDDSSDRGATDAGEELVGTGGDAVDGVDETGGDAADGVDETGGGDTDDGGNAVGVDGADGVGADDDPGGGGVAVLDEAGESGDADADDASGGPSGAGDGDGDGGEGVEAGGADVGGGLVGSGGGAVDPVGAGGGVEVDIVGFGGEVFRVRLVVDGFGGVLVEGPCGGYGPVCPVVEGVAPIDAGGRLAYDEGRAEWGPWVGRVLDLCDDHEALAALDKEWYIGLDNSIDYSAEIPPDAMAFVLAERERHPIVCSDAEAEVPNWKCWGDGSGESIARLRAYLGQFEEPPGPAAVIAWAERVGLDCWDASAERLRYVYVTTSGPRLPQSSVEAAVQDYLERVSGNGRGSTVITGDQLGNSVGWYGSEVETPVDAVLVLPRTVSVIDGVLRGLAQNHSDRLWARNVTVTATDPTGGEGEWRFPLTVQPLETMPFEIENLAGTQDPADVNITITADFSSTIDLTRALRVWEYSYYDYPGTYLYWHNYPEGMVAYPDGKAILEPNSDVHSRDDMFKWLEVDIRRSESTAHPRLSEAARQQTIENLTVYAATFGDGGAVEEVWELTPMTRGPGEWVGEGDDGEWIPGDWIEMRTIPTEMPYDPVPRELAIVGVVGRTRADIWAGGAAPGSKSPGDATR